VVSSTTGSAVPAGIVTSRHAAAGAAASAGRAAVVGSALAVRAAGAVASGFGAAGAAAVPVVAAAVALLAVNASGVFAAVAESARLHARALTAATNPTVRSRIVISLTAWGSAKNSPPHQVDFFKMMSLLAANYSSRM
jgi:hypothetical protein